MASIIWDRDPQEAIDNPYEYNAQKQFHREAIILADKLSETLLNKKEFFLTEKTLEKAIWMLQTDALFSFRDAVQLLDQKKHRVVGRLFRDILESVHLVEYFNSRTPKSKVALNKWFNDVPIMHREFRDFVKMRNGEKDANTKRDAHRILSKFTHRSYKILLYGYALGSDSKIFYDEGWSLPQSISMYYVFLGHFGLLVVDNFKNYGVLEKDEVENTWNQSMEKEQIPRGYLSKEDKVFLGIFDD
jgi:hypothetical protein